MPNESIIVCEQSFPINTRVVLWNEPGGLNGYDTSTYTTKYQDRKTGKIKTSKVSGKRYSSRTIGTVDFRKLQKIVTQFFLHHSGLYRSKDTFHVLHNERRLSVHFILDDDGTLYQTLNLKEKAWHGGINNPMSIGIEIDSRAHAGRFPDAYDEPHQERYGVEPRRKRMDKINGGWVLGYEFNEKQYVTLIKLAIALKKAFPLMSVDGKCDFPRTKSDRIIKSVLSEPKKYHGLISHYNNSSSKIDPVCLDHERLVLGINNNNPLQPSSFILTSSLSERQQYLKEMGYLKHVDGIFGPETQRAIKDFQSDCGLKPDGKWGHMTEYMLNFIMKGKTWKE